MNIYQKPLAFTSILTTGMNPYDASHTDDHFCLRPFQEIYDLAVVLVSSVSWDILKEGSWRLQINRPDLIDPGMQRILGYRDVESDRAGIPPVKALREYAQLTSGSIFASYSNISDYTFLTFYFERFQIVTDFYYHKIDLLSYIKGFLDAQRIALPHWNLTNIAEYFKVRAAPPPYRAIDRAMMSYEIFREIQKLKNQKT